MSGNNIRNIKTRQGKKHTQKRTRFEITKVTSTKKQK